jgi:hypothetical protein
MFLWPILAERKDSHEKTMIEFLLGNPVAILGANKQKAQKFHRNFMNTLASKASSLFTISQK